MVRYEFVKAKEDRLFRLADRSRKDSGRVWERWWHYFCLMCRIERAESK